MSRHLACEITCSDLDVLVAERSPQRSSRGTNCEARCQVRESRKTNIVCLFTTASTAARTGNGEHRASALEVSVVLVLVDDRLELVTHVPYSDARGQRRC